MNETGDLSGEEKAGPAGRWRRLAATGIDLLALGALSLLVVLVTGLFEEADAYDSSARSRK